MLLEKEKIVVTSIFSFSRKFFDPFKDNNSKPLSNIYLVVCKYFEFGEVQCWNPVEEK